jgi:hypothetical protein
VYKIDRTPYGLRLTLAGMMTTDEVRRWERDVVHALHELERPFGVFVDMRQLAPLSDEDQGGIKHAQIRARQLGMRRSVVIVESAEVAREFERIARQTGIHLYERYIYAVDDPHWEQRGLDWIVDGIDPDIGLRQRRSS